MFLLTKPSNARIQQLLDSWREAPFNYAIEWRYADDSVWYDLRSFSRPGQLLTTLGYPMARALQKRFARESIQSMLKAVGEDRGD